MINFAVFKSQLKTKIDHNNLLLQKQSSRLQKKRIFFLFFLYVLGESNTYKLTQNYDIMITKYGRKKTNYYVPTMIAKLFIY